MFDVLVYLYENYWRPDACPEHAQLARKLSAVGFESDEIEEALSWLDGLASVAQSHVGEQAERSMRVYSPAEQEHLGEDSIGFISRRRCARWSSTAPARWAPGRSNSKT